MSNVRQLDVAAGVTIPAWVVSLIADALPIIQAVAGLVAIVVGLLAIYRHFKK